VKSIRFHASASAPSRLAAAVKTARYQPPTWTSPSDLEIVTTAIENLISMTLGCWTLATNSIGQRRKWNDNGTVAAECGVRVVNVCRISRPIKQPTVAQRIFPCLCIRARPRPGRAGGREEAVDAPESRGGPAGDCASRDQIGP